jgi:DNA-binding IscR family transcriptional regulator
MDNDHYILGDAVMHKRLCITAGILAELMLRAPRSVSIPVLEEAIGCPAAQLERICESLWRNGLLQPDPTIHGNWMLAGSPSDITLADLFRSLLSEPPDASRSLLMAPPTQLSHDVDLLVMQAAVGVNQGVFRHLRQFSIDRLLIGSSGIFSIRRKDMRFEESPVASTLNQGIVQ